MTTRTPIAALPLLLSLAGMAVSGCGTMPNGRGWGQDAIYPFDWKRIPQAAKRAALDPVTWGPGGGRFGDVHR